MRTKRFRIWLEEHSAARARLNRLTLQLPRPYRRERPRDPGEARLLRDRGTPDRLIGPVPTRKPKPTGPNPMRPFPGDEPRPPEKPTQADPDLENVTEKGRLPSENKLLP